MGVRGGEAEDYEEQNDEEANLGCLKKKAEESEGERGGKKEDGAGGRGGEGLMEINSSGRMATGLGAFMPFSNKKKKTLRTFVSENKRPLSRIAPLTRRHLFAPRKSPPGANELLGQIRRVYLLC